MTREKSHDGGRLYSLIDAADPANALASARGDGSEEPFFVFEEPMGPMQVVDEAGGLEGAGRTDMAARFAGLLAEQRKRSTVGPLLPIGHEADGGSRRGSR